MLTEDEFGEIAYAAPAMDAGAAGTLQADEVISLSDWRYDDLYAGGVSAEAFIDEMEVYDISGEDIGQVEDVIVGAGGEILSG